MPTTAVAVSTRYPKFYLELQKYEKLGKDPTVRRLADEWAVQLFAMDAERTSLEAEYDVVKADYPTVSVATSLNESKLLLDADATQQHANAATNAQAYFNSNHDPENGEHKVSEISGGAWGGKIWHEKVPKSGKASLKPLVTAWKANGAQIRP